MLQIIPAALAQFISIYLALLLVRVLLTWLPNLDWGNPFLSALSQITDPYLNLFRSVIPPLGGIDFSAILAFIVLQFVRSALLQATYALAAGSYMAYSSFKAPRFSDWWRVGIWVHSQKLLPKSRGEMLPSPLLFGLSQNGPSSMRPWRRTLPTKPEALNCFNLSGGG